MDIVTLNHQPAETMTPMEQRRGWAQIGASAAVKATNTLLTVGGAVGLGLLGGSVLGPVGAILGGATGLVGGLLSVAFGGIDGKRRGQIFRPLKNAAARLGARTGAAFSKPLQGLFPKAVKEYQLGPLARPFEVSKADIEEFKSKLKPGDVLLTLNNVNSMFHWLVQLKTSELDHTHAAFYIGDGQVVEAAESTGKVGYRDVSEVLESKSHIVAIRPHYAEGEAEQAVRQARTYVGRRYDWLAQLDDKRLGCVEVPYHALGKAAPGHDVPITNLWGVKKFIFPTDYLHTKNSTVVAESGVNRSCGAMRLAKYSWAAQELEDQALVKAAAASEQRASTLV